MIHERSTKMAVEIETFEEEELIGTDTGPSPEMDGEAIKLIEQMGLDGQRSLVVKEEGEEVGQRNPYRKLSSEERRVYTTVYPKTSKVEEYKAGIIPLRVLQVAAHARPLFQVLYILHSREHDSDPVLVGTDGSGYDPQYWLLARWGDALKPYQELKDLAIKAKTEEWRGEVTAKLEDCKAFLASLEHKVGKYFRGDYVSTP